MKLDARTQLTDKMWRNLAPKIPDLRRCQGQADSGARRFVEGALWICRTGAPWRDPPRCFGNWSTVYRRFRRWATAGVWAAVQKALVAWHEIDRSTVSIDSTHVRVHQHAATSDRTANAVGRSRGGLTTKIHAAVANDKALLAPRLTPGQHADIRSAQSVLRQAKATGQVLADRAYDADALVQWLKHQDIAPVIPARRNCRMARPIDKAAYAQRNQVERFYAHIKQFRRLATRYEKTRVSFTAVLLLVSSQYLL